jgi:hypothetical protein
MTPGPDYSGPFYLTFRPLGIVKVGAYKMCNHLRTKVNTSGGMYFSAGEIIDTIQETVICLDCGEEIEPEAEADLDFMPIEAEPEPVYFLVFELQER